jgi:hypothetical protein
MNEDQDRTRIGHRPLNFAVLRHLAIIGVILRFLLKRLNRAFLPLELPASGRVSRANQNPARAEQEPAAKHTFDNWRSRDESNFHWR